MGNETIINSGTSGFSQKLKTRINNVAGTRITRFTSGDVIDGRYRVISRISQTTGEADIYKRCSHGSEALSPEGCHQG